MSHDGLILVKVIVIWIAVLGFIGLGALWDWLISTEPVDVAHVPPMTSVHELS